MSADEWDADDFQPQEAVPKAAGTDKWVGEDEDDVKDNWDDDDAEEGNKDADKGDAENKAFQVKKKKPLKDRIAEKEAKAREEAEQKKKEREEKNKKMTPQEEMAEKLRRQKLQEEADLSLARETFGMEANDALAGRTIDLADPSNREEFEELAKHVKNKFSQFEKSSHYNFFAEAVIRDLSIAMDPEELKKLSVHFNALASEKSKQLKASKGKKKSKKATLSVGKSENLNDFGEDGGYDEFDDFI